MTDPDVIVTQAGRCLKWTWTHVTWLALQSSCARLRREFCFSYWKRCDTFFLPQCAVFLHHGVLWGVIDIHFTCTFIIFACTYTWTWCCYATRSSLALAYGLDSGGLTLWPVSSVGEALKDAAWRCSMAVCLKKKYCSYQHPCSRECGEGDGAWLVVSITFYFRSCNWNDTANWQPWFFKQL